MITPIQGANGGDIPTGFFVHVIAGLTRNVLSRSSVGRVGTRGTVAHEAT
ncbi:MAG: hypothetical protein FWF09_03565 [Bacteroidales bacterium]|nr:hypothetical protein [Bacteroidales bacterium]